MPSISDAPGLKVRRREEGPQAYYWIASAASRLAGHYPIKSVRLHHDTADARAAACRIYTAELLEWIGSNGKTTIPPFDGTIRSLIDNYERDEDSPYRKLRENTQRSYDHDLKILRAAVGNRRIELLTGKDFRRWHDAFVKPAVDDEGKPVGERRVRRAHGLMTMLRMLFGFGVTMRFKGCDTCVAILGEMRFETPPKRQQTMAFEHAEAVVNEALASGRRSIALGQALQFELGVRQIDVIGYWVKAEPGAVGIVAHGKRWTGGLSWADITAKMTLSKVTTKTAAEGEWDLSLCPLVLKAIAAFTREDRVGPMVVDETTGRPYMPGEYSKTWRPLATKAGVPAAVWNRDSRSGAITEGDQAGASGRDLQHMATHSDPSTTELYVRRNIEAARRVQTLRLEHRERTKRGA